MLKKNRYYKFRNLDSLLRYQELEKHELHFSSPIILNDPMEKQKNFVFNGDEVNWKCLIRQYILFFYWNICFQGFKYVDRIYSYEWLNKDRAGYIFIDRVDELTQIIINKPFVKEYIKVLSNTNVTVDEMYSFIQMFDKELLQLCEKEKKHESITYEVFKHELTGNRIVDGFVNNCLINESTNLISNYFRRIEIFINVMISYCFPPYLVLSLCKGYNNTVMWSHYAKEHTGVCLIFEVESDAKDNSIDIMEFKYFEKFLKIQKVEYNTMEPIDVFSNMGCIGHMMVQSFNEYGGMKSKFWGSFKPESFNKLHFNIFANEIGIKKSPDWEYEKEYRIFIENQGTDSYMNIEYRQDQLVGIIFGMNCDEKLQKKTLDIIKLLNNKKIEIYKAFYNFRNSDIDICRVNGI